jgi:hypothetical protein
LDNWLAHAKRLGWGNILVGAIDEGHESTPSNPESTPSYQDFLDNWLAHAKRLGWGNILVGAIDEGHESTPSNPESTPSNQDFLDNWLAHAKRLGWGNILVGAIDEGIFEHCNKMGVAALSMNATARLAEALNVQLHKDVAAHSLTSNDFRANPHRYMYFVLYLCCFTHLFYFIA